MQDLLHLDGPPGFDANGDGQNGNTVGRHDYLPFGDEIAANAGGRDSTFGTQDFVNQKFTAKEWDSETGLDYFGERYYSGALSRFTTTDPNSPMDGARLRGAKSRPSGNGESSGGLCVVKRPNALVGQ